MTFDKKGITGTVIFHTTLLIMVLIFGFSTPLPLPGEKGILINFGNTETGFGTTCHSCRNATGSVRKKPYDTGL
jgi:hypothetical protein